MSFSVHEKAPIPTGTELGIVLNSPHITYGEINSILKAKGVFVGNTDKSVTIPLLTSTLLLPSEFFGLIDGSVSRELRPKLNVSRLDLSAKNKDWMTPIKDSLIDDVLFSMDGNESVEIVHAPKVVVDSNNKIRVPFTIRRKDYSQDWTKRELDFTGEVTFEQRGDKLVLDCATSHTSKETDSLAKKIVYRASKLMNDAGAVESETPRNITFSSFNNVQRVRFFKKLTGGFAQAIKAGNVNEIEIDRDASGPKLPNDPQVAWMNESVRRLRVDGKRLNDIFLISDEKYSAYYHIQKMDIVYDFSFKTNSGSCRIVFSFNSPSKKRGSLEHAEFTFEFIKVTFDHNISGIAKEVVRKEIAIYVKEMIEKCFDEAVKT